jgi:uncharacterized protein (DUF2384 family)
VSRKTAVEKALGPGIAAQIVGSGALSAARGEKLRCIWDGLLDTYNQQQAVAWLQTASPALDDRRPLDVMRDPDGLDRILEIVTRLAWGLTE